MITHEVGSQAYNSLREEIEWSLKLPHKSIVSGSINLTNLPNTKLSKCYQNFLKKMDEKLYGMSDIKLKMLHIINDRRTGKGRSCRNIGINGPPGCGKTQIGKAMANVLGLPFEKISVGGMTDSTIFKGSDRVWSGASPSIILQKMAKMKSSGGVIMLDEIDKLGRTAKGHEVQDSILEISDPDHNNEFGDSYLNKYYHDLSGIFFIYCMNGTDGLTDAFKSRIDIHEITPYDTDDKTIILPKYVLPEALSDIGMSKNSISFDRYAIKHIIDISSDDPGIRTIQKITKQIVGEINMYNSIILPDGTVNIDLGYTIPKFKLPIKINKTLLLKLLN